MQIVRKPKSINSLEGWNSFANEKNTRTFIGVYDRPPNNQLEVKQMVQNALKSIKNQEESTMNGLQIVKSEQFGTVEADIYSNGQEVFMTINQLAECLEYIS